MFLIVGVMLGAYTVNLYYMNSIENVIFFLQDFIPIILCCVTLHPDSKERDSLLNILFNLIKRPDVEQR